MTSAFRKICSAALLCLALGAFAGCGVKGSPQPDYSGDMFGFGKLSASIESAGVVFVNGTLTGSFENADYLVLEMQPVDGEHCAGCPFVPQEKLLIESKEIWQDGNGSTFDVTYLPMFKADMYRWRVVGYNVYAGIPAQISEVQTVGTERAFIEQGMPVPVPPVQ